MIVTTLPVVLPLVTAAGFDKVWFGVFLVIVVASWLRLRRLLDSISSLFKGLLAMASAILPE